MPTMNKRAKILWGIAIAPWFMILWDTISNALTNPYWEQSNPLFWFFYSVVSSYLSFLLYAGISHVILRYVKAVKSWQYVVVMFSVSFVIYGAVTLSSFMSYEAYQQGLVEIVKNNTITPAGYIYIAQFSLLRAAIYGVCFLVFWVITVKNTNQIRMRDDQKTLE
jgi:hypothetical protein